MCTVTFLRAGGQTFITSNRDESPGRRATGLVSAHQPDGTQYWFPLDASSGGSWIALSGSGRAVCLLNGGYEPFVPDPPYRMSRGLVVTEAILAPDADVFLHDQPLTGIAPFTLLIYESDRLQSLVWTGTRRDVLEHAAWDADIWSSVTLYPEPVRMRRRALFEHWLAQHPAFDRDAIIDFHRTGGEDPENDFVMNRGDLVKTLSVTSIVLGAGTGSILHLDLEADLQEEVSFRHAPA
jgi:hypothetical protein